MWFKSRCLNIVIINNILHRNTRHGTEQCIKLCSPYRSMASNLSDSGQVSVSTDLQQRASTHGIDTNDVDCDGIQKETLANTRDSLKNNSTLILEPYLNQKKTHWPRDGRHILAQYDDQTVVVYQAFKHKIAKFAVENQRFGGEDYSTTRMSWIKTNFLWMMYRSGWASKHNQEHILAIRISRRGFDTILEHAYTVKYQKEEKLKTDQIQVRLQWDPDHTPTYDKETRRAIQLGLKDKVLETFCKDWIVSITDITDLVKQLKRDYDTGGAENLQTPSERIYQVRDQNVASQIGLLENE